MMYKLIVSLVLLLAASACSIASVTGDASAPIGPSCPKIERSNMSSINPTQIAPPLVIDGRKYAPVPDGSALGLPQKTGYVSVIDIAKTELLFVIQVFKTTPHVRTGITPQQITSLEHDPNESRLVIGTSTGECYALYFPGLSVSPLETKSR